MDNDEKMGVLIIILIALSIPTIFVYDKYKESQIIIEGMKNGYIQRIENSQTIWVKDSSVKTLEKDK